MTQSQKALRRPDFEIFKMVFAAAFITLYDLLLSDALSLPLALQHSTLAGVKALDGVASYLDFLVPAVTLAIMVILWLARQDTRVYHTAIIYLVWVTLRLAIKVALVLIAITSFPSQEVSGLLKDTIVLWLVIFVIFGIWYWIIDGDGPHVRQKGLSKRYDFAFPQHTAPFSGWENWSPRFWDYLFLGFCGSTQFGLGDTNLLSVRSKVLLMVQVTLSMIVIIFIAAIAI